MTNGNKKGLTDYQLNKFLYLDLLDNLTPNSLMTKRNSDILTEKHSFLNDLIFKSKITVLQAKRLVKNVTNNIKRYKSTSKLTNKPIISFSESDLWNTNDNSENWILTAGKIENLRIAAQRLNGIEIKAGEIFSFWKQIGNPNIGKGYVIGREIREGCIVPTVAGGLCQLSNALYDAAINANLTIIERHQHTKIIKGSLAEKDRDATVKWNYVDLRFKSEFNFRIEIELTSDKFFVAFKSANTNKNTSNSAPTTLTPNTLNDCYSCGNLSCFKHPDKSGEKQISSTKTFVLDEKWPEYETYVNSISEPNDIFIVPMKKNKFINTNRYNWKTTKNQVVKTTSKAGLMRALKMRYFSKGKNIFKYSLALDEKIAKRAAQLIPIESTHIVIAQNLLPYFFETGALGGRTFDVLMTRLPIEILEQRLDKAFKKHYNSSTLKDFRAPSNLKELEILALTKARKVITPHTDIAKIFNNKVEKLAWKIPTGEPSKGKKILFPTSAVGRKGAYELKRLIKELNLSIVIAGNAIENIFFWEDIVIEKFNGNLSEIGLIIYPTYVEHQPRTILKAIAMKIPVITTSVCGIEPSDLITIIEPGDYNQLKNVVNNHLLK